jgi:predicted Zn-dependent protease with MMP-like domain
VALLTVERLEMTRKAFEDHVASALEMIPERFQDPIHNVICMAKDTPSSKLFDSMGIAASDTLLGLHKDYLCQSGAGIMG